MTCATPKTKLISDFPIGPSGFVVLKEDGTVTFDGELETKDRTEVSNGIEYQYRPNERSVLVRVVDESASLPAADFSYRNGSWWGEPPAGLKDEPDEFGRVLVASPWITDFASQFGLVCQFANIYHQPGNTLQVGPITLSISGRILIGPHFRQSSAAFREVDYENVLCRGTSLHSDSLSFFRIPTVEILDKQSGVTFYYKKRFEGWWDQFAITGYCRDLMIGERKPLTFFEGVIEFLSIPFLIPFVVFDIARENWRGTLLTLVIVFLLSLCFYHKMAGI